jgi:Ca-activated chloride channel homolog
MQFEFGLEQPEVAWLLLTLPLFFIFARFTKQESSRQRMHFHALLRSLIITLLVLAASGLHISFKEKRLALAFVVDSSPSITPALLIKAKAFVRDTLARLDQDKDRAAIISFAGEAELIDQGLAGSLSVLKLKRAKGQESNVSAALRLARASLPGDYERRVILLTDGNETRGDAAQEAARLASDGIALSVVPLARDDVTDALLSSIEFSTPTAKEGENIDARVTVHATKPMTGTLTLYRDGFTKAEWKREITLVPGRNPSIIFKDEMADKGLYAYEAVFESKQDKVKQNNRALGFMSVEGRPKVLIIERVEEDARHLARALSEEQISVRVRSAIGTPSNLADLESFDAVIFSDVPSVDSKTGVSITVTQMELIRNYVQKLGGGFIMIGGEHSFGLGGYYKTPIADVLPVKLDIPKEMEVPTIAMCLILDKSGSMQGQKIQLAREASSRVVDLLKARDYMGVITFDSYFHKEVPMMRASKKALIRDRIARIGASGGTFLFPAMLEAYKDLRKVKTKLKHAIILSDGHTNPADHRGLAARMRRERMTISTVAIGQGADTTLMKAIARTGKGRFYYTDDFRTIPQIFTQETIKVSKSSITEHPFRAQVVKDHQCVRGINFEGSPYLYGYVATRPKPSAEVILSTHLNEPLFCIWNFGLGKSAAFTSDAKSKWAYGWLRWDGYQRFWAQAVRTVMRNSGRAALILQSQVQVKGDKARIRIDAADGDGRFVNKLPLKAEILYWSGEKAAKGKSVAKVKLQQTAPGRYEGAFQSDQPGGYIVKTVDGKGHLSVTGFAISYPKEFAQIGMDRPKLVQWATLGQGSFAPKISELIARQQEARSRRSRLVELLIMLGLLLIPVDIALRRIQIA